MPPDDLDRDKLYSSGADDFDDDELEVEPPDPDVLAAEERRAAEALTAHRRTIDINEVYRDLEANADTKIVEEWISRLRGARFQFQLKHLLIFTAVVALALAIGWSIGFGTFLIVSLMVAVAGVSLYLKLEENKRQEEANRRREQMYAERRAHTARQSGQSTPPASDSTSDQL